MPSNAVSALSARTAEIECLLRVYRSRKVRGAKEITFEGQAIFRSSLVLLCSHVEGFFEDLIINCVAALDANVTNTSDLPLSFRMHQVLGSYASWDMKSLDKRWAFLKLKSNSALLRDNAPYQPGNADGEVHINSFATPNCDKIKKLFRTIGIEDVWKEFAKVEPNAAYKSEIDAIVAKRGDIAHGDLTAQVGESDIRQYMNNFHRTASVFDQLTERFLGGIIAGFGW